MSQTTLNGYKEGQTTNTTRIMSDKTKERKTILTDKEIETMAYTLNDKYEAGFIQSVQRWRFGKVVRDEIQARLDAGSAPKVSDTGIVKLKKDIEDYVADVKKEKDSDWNRGRMFAYRDVLDNLDNIISGSSVKVSEPTDEPTDKEIQDAHREYNRQNGIEDEWPEGIFRAGIKFHREWMRSRLSNNTETEQVEVFETCNGKKDQHGMCTKCCAISSTSSAYCTEVYVKTISRKKV